MVLCIVAGCSTPFPTAPETGWAITLLEDPYLGDRDNTSLAPSMSQQQERLIPWDRTTATQPVNLMQVLVCYSATSATHTAFRLESAQSGIIFWDPAGSYGISDSSITRTLDRVLESPPTIDMYKHWLLYRTRDVGLEVFEWELDSKEATRLYSILLDGTDKTHPEGSFHTSGIGLFCCWKVCDFLDRFGPEFLSIPERWMNPSSLATHLWTQQPSRVWVFEQDEAVLLFEPAH